jgi:3,4-dihydroxy 2-butanone 4-phosphate synthase/GTP cyclohydrolase II
MNKPTGTEKTSDRSAEDDVIDLHALPEWLTNYSRQASTLNPEETLETPVFGRTVYLAETMVPTRYGDFRVCIFQDIIHKGYILALCYGDVEEADVLYTRMHSSCVTSETLGGCDCDCVQQLEGAMKKISESGKGVLFYLLQEGRGVGYSAKARDRMLVQASDETISTFEAYRLLGLQKDYRQYLNIKDIVHILGIDSEWIVLTNNPDKVNAMKRNGLTVRSMESIEFEPGPFNAFYLKSKQESGHKLEQPGDKETLRIELPEAVVPFKPRRMETAQRFIYMASYLLPIRAIDDQIVLPYEEMIQLLGEDGLQKYMVGASAPIQSFESLRGNRILLTINGAEIKDRISKGTAGPLERLSMQPYWFRVHVYFDVVSGDDFVVLTHGASTSYDRPIVRIQSESILNRFPVKVDENKAKYQRAIQHIIRYGCGAVVLVYQDGRGAGFGAYAMDRMLMETGQSMDTKESYRKLGISFDQRDYSCLFEVLKSHLVSTNIQMIMNSPNSLVTKSEYSQALNQSGLNVENWIFLEAE